MNTCKYCGKHTKNPKFCSRGCSITFFNKLNPKRNRDVKNNRICAFCRKKYYGYGKYCSRECYFLSRDKASEFKFNNGLYSNQGVKKYLVKKYDYCFSCKRKRWLKRKITLELDHIDGDITNNMPDNLRLLCPNCHSQTDTYKAKNTNNPNGKERRRKRYLKSLI